AEDILHAHARATPTEYEQVVYTALADAFAAHDIVYFDNVRDYQSAAHASAHHRPQIFDAVFKALYERIEFAGKRMVVSSSPTGLPARPHERVLYRPLRVTLGAMKQPDYRHVFAEHLGEAAIAGVDFENVYTYSRGLSGYYLKIVCDLLKASGA